MRGPVAVRWLLPGMVLGIFLAGLALPVPLVLRVLVPAAFGAWGLLRFTHSGHTAAAAVLLGVSIGFLLLPVSTSSLVDAVQPDAGPQAYRLDVIEDWPSRGSAFRAVAKGASGQRFLLHGANPFAVGSRLWLVAEPVLPTVPVHPADFDESAFLQGRGISALLEVQVVLEASASPGILAALSGWSSAAAERVKQRIRSVRSGQGPALVVALLTGDKSGLSRQARMAFSRSGLAHLMAVSGFHTGMVAGAIWILLMPLARWRLLRTCIMVLAVWGYVLLCGAPGSAIRAAIMVSMAAWARAISRRPDGLAILSVTGVVMLCSFPASLHDLGLRMSFAATAAIMLLHWRLERTGLKTWPKRAVMALGVPVVANLATAPLAWPAFGMVPVVFLPANLMATPWVTLLSMVSALWLALPAAWDPLVAPVVLAMAEALVEAVDLLSYAAPIRLPLDRGMVLLAGVSAALGAAFALMVTKAHVRFALAGVLGALAVLRWQDHIERHPHQVEVEGDVLWREDGEVAVFNEDGGDAGRGLKWKTRTLVERVSNGAPVRARCCGNAVCFSTTRLRYRLADGRWSAFNSSRSHCGSPDPHMLPRPPCP